MDRMSEEQFENVIELKHITKVFPGIKANDDISLTLRKGEIHALLGENGAGKSTLMSVLFGLYQQDGGEIYVRGEKVKIKNPNDATRYGIGMVHQHFKLVGCYTALQNIILGYEPVTKAFGFLKPKSVRQSLIDLCEKFHFKVDLDKKIDVMPVGEQQKVEILKMLYRNNDILIFDEPTAVLTPQEIEELMQSMKQLVSEGKSILFISHKLNEVKALSDKVSILRHGRVVFNGKTEDYSPSEIAALMTGHEVEIASNTGERRDGKVALSIENLVVKSDRGFNALDGFDLQVKEGEIVGLAGVSGNGQRELAEAINGIRKTDGGKILFYGDEIQNLSPREVIKKGMGYIPEERNTEGIVPSMSIKENIILKDSNDRFSLHHILKDKDIEKYASLLRENYDIRSPSIHVAAGSLSGGNIQKVILAREIDRKPKFLVCVYPIRGLDMGAAEFIHRLLLDLRNKGVGILLISEELEEIMNLSDRIAVIFKGKNQKMMDASEATTDKLGILMAGVNDEA